MRRLFFLLRKEMNILTNFLNATPHDVVIVLDDNTSFLVPRARDKGGLTIELRLKTIQNPAGTIGPFKIPIVTPQLIRGIEGALEECRNFDGHLIVSSMVGEYLAGSLSCASIPEIAANICRESGSVLHGQRVAAIHFSLVC